MSEFKIYGVPTKAYNAMWSFTQYCKWGQFGAVDCAPFFSVKEEVQREVCIKHLYFSPEQNRFNAFLIKD